MIEAHDLSRRYGDFTAVDGISFAVDEGEIVGMLGPNGAGKTTTIRMISGFLPPSRGTVTVAGRDLFREPRQARRELGYLPENVTLYTEMRVREYLAYRGRLQGLGRGELRDALGEAVERALLTDVREQVIGTLSKGYRQRVALAAAILHRPRVLVLDEPTVGLDPKQIIAIRELIRELGRRRTLLLSTHILPEVELLCDRVLIIDRGRIVAQGTPAELTARSRQQRYLRIEVRPAPGEAAAEEVRDRLAALAGVEGVERLRARDRSRSTGAGACEAGAAVSTAAADGASEVAAPGAGLGKPADASARLASQAGTPTAVPSTVPSAALPATRPPATAPTVTARLAVAAGADPREAVFRAAVASGWVLLELAEERASLEDVFVRLTTRDPGTGPDGDAASGGAGSPAADLPAPGTLARPGADDRRAGAAEGDR